MQLKCLPERELKEQKLKLFALSRLTYTAEYIVALITHNIQVTITQLIMLIFTLNRYAIITINRNVICCHHSCRKFIFVLKLDEKLNRKKYVSTK